MFTELMVVRAFCCTNVGRDVGFTYFFSLFEKKTKREFFDALFFNYLNDWAWFWCVGISHGNLLPFTQRHLLPLSPMVGASFSSTAAKDTGPPTGLISSLYFC